MTRIIGRIALAVGALALLIVTVFVALRWSAFPSQVPMRYNAAGAISAYGGKGSLWVMLFLGWLLFAIMIVCSFFPGAMNIPGLNPKSSPRVMAAAMLTSRLLAMALALMFAYMALCSALCRNLGSWFLPLSLVGCTAPIAVTVAAALRR